MSSTLYKVMISSPSDLKAERVKIYEEINNTVLDNEVGFKATMWETDQPSVPTRDAQGEINKNLLESSDIVCAVFRDSFGSPTKEADSGTEEEIIKAYRAGKGVMIYFLEPTDAVKNDLNKLQSLTKIVQFKTEYQNYGIYHDCKSLDDIVKLLRKDLIGNVKYLEGNNNQQAPTSNRTTMVDNSEKKDSLNTSDDYDWFTQSIASIITEKLSNSTIKYKYQDDLTFHENLLMADVGPLGKKQYEEFLNIRAQAFDDKYGDYDYNKDLRSIETHWYEPLRSIIADSFASGNLKVLDVGGNSGQELLDIFDRMRKFDAIQFHVVDISHNAIEKGETLFKSKKRFNVVFTKANMEKNYLPTDMDFDVCLCLRSIQSRGVQRNDALIQMSKHIRPGGMIFVSIPNGYRGKDGKLTSGLYDHRTKTFLLDRPMVLASKIYRKLDDYGFESIKIISLETEILVYGIKKETASD